MQSALQIAAALMFAGQAQAWFDYAGCQSTAAGHAGALASALGHSVNPNQGFTIGFAQPHYTSLQSACNSFIGQFDSAPSDCLSDDFASVFNDFDSNLSNVLKGFCDNAGAIGGDDYARECGDNLWGWYGNIATKWGSLADCDYVDSIWDAHCSVTDAFSYFYDFFDCGNFDFNWGDCGAFDHHTRSCQLSASSFTSSPTTHASQTVASSSAKSTGAASSSSAKTTGAASSSSGSASPVVSTYSDYTTSYRCRVVGSAAGGLNA